MTPTEQFKKQVNTCGLTKKKVAEHLGICTRTLDRWINGDSPTIDRALGAMDRMREIEGRSVE